MRPFKHLPMDFPCNYNPSDKDPEFFYRNFALPITRDMIQMTNVGIPVDLKAVEELRNTTKNVLNSVKETIKNNLIVKRYLKTLLPELNKEYKAKVLAKVRTKEDYLATFNPSNILHRTFAVNTYLKSNGMQDSCKDKWTIAHIKKFNTFKKIPFLQNLIDKNLPEDSSVISLAMEELAEYKAALWNKPRIEKSKISVELPEFNPGSAKQLQGIFKMLGIPPITVSDKTGEGSWSRKNIEMVRKTVEDKHILEFIDAVIDHSFSAIILNNFIVAFDSFVVNKRLHGNIKVFGAKSFRPTSDSPNLLNMPSSGSIYASPLKRCFVASEGRLIYTADLSALEDRVVANLSNDTNKQNIFLEGLDGHSLNACGYFPDKIEKIMGKNTDNVAYVKEFHKLSETNKNINSIRSASKAPTFKLAYGGYPDEHKGGVITQELFDNYHNVLYPGITAYRENYVLPFAQKNGYIHLGLGCNMKVDDAENKIRTINNATIQFWSILTLIAVNEINYRIIRDGLEDKIDVISTIYDSIYFDVDNNPETIKWLNDNIIEIMTVQYLEEEVVHNEAEGEIGLNFADLHKVTNNASIDEIKKVLGKVYNGNQ